MATKKLEPWLAAFDTEDDGAGNPYLFCCVHERGTFHAGTRERFLEQLERLRDRAGERGLEVWAFNLEYDTGNLWGPDRIAECRLQMGRAKLYGVTWKRIKFRDVARFTEEGTTLAKLGELVGLPKLHRDSSVAYCMRDAAITYRAARYIKTVFRRLGERTRMTLPATVYQLWSRAHFGGRLKGARPEVVAAGRSAYYGGRTECFALGTFPGVHVIDAASMFPWAMVAAEYPVVWGPIQRVGYGGEFSVRGIYRAVVRSELELPVLPVRTETGTVFPNGAWEAWYTGLELAYFASLGGKVKILDGFAFSDTCRPFDTYVRRFFRLKSRARGPARAIYKLCLNSLYGKFGQTGEISRAETVERYYAKDRNPLGVVRYWNGLMLWREERTPPPWGNMVWAALTTARARVRLHQEMRALRERGCRLIYCDTDSVTYQGKADYPRKAPRPGVFELRGDYLTALVVGKKEYALEVAPGLWEPHAKGVPRDHREEYLRTGTTSYKLPAKIRSAARDGVPVNVWRETRKTRRAGEGRRARGPDGALVPVRIEAGR